MSDALTINSVEVRAQATVLVDVQDLTIQPGEMTAVVGPSGSGKTLLLRALAHVLPPGLTHNVQTTPARARVAWMPQDCMAALDPLRTVGEQLAQTLLTSGSPDPVSQALERVGLKATDADRFVAELSGGMAQRVVLAQALAMQVHTLLVDEPTSGLDPLLTQQILDLIAAHTGPRLGVLWVSHDLRQVRGRADRIWVMHAGTVIETADSVDALNSDVARSLVNHTPGLKPA
jgi:peptide/nickel transport system ATP-binding protein